MAGKHASAILVAHAENAAVHFDEQCFSETVVQQNGSHGEIIFHILFSLLFITGFEFIKGGGGSLYSYRK